MYDHQCFPFFNMPYGLGWVFMILFWAFAISGVIAIVRWLAVGIARREPDMSSPAHKTPADMGYWGHSLRK
jgi:hypothetical protein